jgi:hypothetical protein
VIAMPSGPRPTLIGFMALLVVVWIGITVSPVPFTPLAT